MDQDAKPADALKQFAACIFDPADVVELRMLPARKSERRTPVELAAHGPRLTAANYNGQNIYVGANPRRRKGGRKAADVALARCLFADWDNIDVAEARRRWESARLPEPTLLIHSGHGVHAYWRLVEPLTDLVTWSRLQKSLIAAVGSDSSIHDPPRIMRLPGFDNCKFDPRVPCRIVEADPARRYPLDQLNVILTAHPQAAQGQAPAPQQQIRNSANGVIQRARSYLATIPGAVSGEHGHDRTFHAACVLVLGFDLCPDEAWPLMAQWNATCVPPWDEPDLRRKLAEADKQPGERGYLLRPSNNGKPQPGHGTETAIPFPTADDPWPDALAPEAFHGVAGDIVRAIEPHSEADPAALLVQLLTGFGNLIGSRAHFRAEGDVHPGKLFCCLVGVTSKGRKGTSWGQVANVLRSVDPEWAENRVLSGLSSGEGLIWQVRDPIIKSEPIREKRQIVGYQDVVADPGVSDKRLLILETELGSVLRVLRRESNTLSAVVRDAWDKSDLRTLTKNSPAVSTGCHISIIGHITRNELRRHLTETDMANGFANRFLWLCVRRSKCLPEGGALHQVDFAPLVGRLQEAAAFAEQCGELCRNDEARAVWAAVYPTLSAGGPGLLGAVTSRAEAQTMRLALLYALLDQSPVIRVEHLTAALAVWQYAEASARHIFGSALGDPTADEILRALRGAAKGMTRNDLREHFHRHKGSGEIGRALAVLAECGLARCERRDTEGRPAEVWYAT